MPDKRGGAELTAVERSVIRQLQQDGRISYGAIGRTLGVPEPTIRRAAQRLVEEGVISITAVGNPQVLGIAAMAWLALRVNWGDVEDLPKRMLEIPGIDYVVTTLGRFQVMAEVGARDLADLMRKVAMARALPGVRAAETFVYLDLFHQEFRWAKPLQESTSSETSDGHTPTEVERQLIMALRQNGRRSFRQVARDLALSERQVRSCYSGLVERGVIRVMAVVNPARLGLDTMAWLGVRVQPQVPVAEVAAAFAADARVDYLVICAGRYEMLAETACADDSELGDVVARLGALRGVEEIEVFKYVRLQYVDESVWSAGRVSALE